MKKSLFKQRVKRIWFFATRLEHHRVGGKHNVPKMRKVK